MSTIPDSMPIEMQLEAALEALKQGQLTRAEFDQMFPAHTCVDNPNLACPACTKWEDKRVDDKSFDNGI